MKNLYYLMCSMIILGEWTQAKPSPLDVIEINVNIKKKSKLPPNSPVIRGNDYGNGNGNGNIGNGNGNRNVGDGNGNGNKGNTNGNNAIGDNNGNNNVGDNNGNNQKVLVKYGMSGQKCALEDSVHAVFMKHLGMTDAEITKLDTDIMRKEHFKNVAGYDGVVSYQEFVDSIKEYIAHLGLERSFLSFLPKFFKIVDLDRDGSLTYEEVIKTRCEAFTLADRIMKMKGFSNRARGHRYGY